MEQNTIKVWDIFVRIFHWSLVILFIIAYLTGEEESNLHIYAGYAILALIVSRLIWGFIGSKYALFTNFIKKTSVVIDYVKTIKSNLTEHKPRQKIKHYIGHNPAGGYMIVALLLMLFVVSYSGLKVYGLEGGGPLASNVTISLISTANADDDEHEEHESGENEAAEEFWEEIHELSANLTILLILLHVLGVIVSSRLHGENLAKAMVTGRKKANLDTNESE